MQQRRTPGDNILTPMSSACVLVVDDSEPVRALLVQALRQNGFAVYEAETGTAALRVAFDVRPSLAIVDQWMPGMTGAELIRLLRAAPVPELRAMAIIGLSGRAGSERDLLGAGAGSFLAKPFGESDLLVAVRAALGVRDAPASGAA
jgi:DNA-binding response OmpR family regulator